MKIAFRRNIPHYSEPTLRATLEPELRLIAAVVGLAVKEATKPDGAKGDEAKRLRYYEKRKKLVADAKDLLKRWRHSGLSAKNFEYEYDLRPGQLCHATELIKRAERLGLLEYPTAEQFIFNDSTEPFSFIWCLIQLYGDPECSKKQIRELCAKALNVSKVCGNTQNGSGV